METSVKHISFSESCHNLTTVQLSWARGEGAPTNTQFSAWQPGDAAMQGQRKKKQRDKEERKKESSRVAKFRETKKEIDGETDNNLTEEKSK